MARVVAKGFRHVVRELSIALPSVAQQIEVRLTGLESPQIVDGVEVCQTGIVGDVELQEVKAGEQGLGDGIQGRQREALLVFQAYCYLDLKVNHLSSMTLRHQKYHSLPIRPKRIARRVHSLHWRRDCHAAFLPGASFFKLGNHKRSFLIEQWIDAVSGKIKAH